MRANHAVYSGKEGVMWGAEVCGGPDGTCAQVPQGATPRSLRVHLRGGLTRSAKPGDAVTLSGIFLPQPLTGFRVCMLQSPPCSQPSCRQHLWGRGVPPAC